MRRRPQAPQRGGLLGVVEAYFSNPTRTAITFFALAAVVLLLIIVVSLKSCDNSSAADAAKQQVVVSQSGTSSTSSSSDTASSSTSSSTSTSGDGSTVQSSVDAATNEPTVVTVTVADGEVSWVEITNDDVSEVADTISGPWEQSYTVTKEIVIEVNDITAVTVTENGKQVSFDQKPSGLGSITIEGTPIETTEDATTSTDASGATTATASTTTGSTS
jgi:stringent starvation protein B